MLRLFLACGVTLCIAPAFAWAGPLQLQVGPNFGAGAVDASVAPGPGDHMLDGKQTEFNKTV